ncbi:hypothetical protein DOTSEDRAFT_74509 [Dothistroma septosporum NZE10]|uniref:Cryptic loci regulator 2 N-terminal domain-containing protein n=1 Tax=Dothistroma septosporum (strain NZE10 / CBS 128990) TaxID=675120 RepID=N1PFT6_DOTSN|nr:hypothetical protein DOTSEDRAFT_74509 [Dothistroma septosporum NZE10]
MARFYPLYVRRSDGKLEIVTKGAKRKETNSPTDDQLDQKPDKDGVSDYYREVKPEETKHLDWRRKLGGMLARELDWKDKSGNDNGYILVSFPENYRLFEHVKKTERDGKLEVKNKTHAAGGNDRQDAYLYGHPAGRRKRFRSPNDFFPHLLWLSTDESGDPDNCSCKLCSPEDLEHLVPGARIKSEKTIKQEHDSKVGVNQPTSMARQSSAQNAKVALPPRQVAPPAPKQVPTLLAPAKYPEQNIDRQYKGFMFRPGELVWFSRGQAWGLATVLRRWVQTSGTSNINTFHYSVLPLTHPAGQTTQTTRTTHELRPWLAWSVPQFTMSILNSISDQPRYEHADWNGMMQGKYGRGDLEVDASILAAKMVDSTYTPFNKSRTSQPEPGVFQQHYDGIYLGCEKIWVGEPVRLHIGSGTDIIVVHDVVERKRVSAMNPKQVLEQSCRLIGDVYKLSAVTHRDSNVPTPASPNDNPQLPQRLTEDLAYRNALSMRIRQVANYWQLIRPGHAVDLNDIKGRWYEASLLLPLLQPALFAGAVKKGEVQESSLWMNSRGDCINSNRPAQVPRLPRENHRRDNRKQAYAQSISPDTEFTDGIQPPTLDNVDPNLEGSAAGSNSDNAIDIDPKFDTANDVMHQDGNHGGLDEFMNLDGMDDSHMPDFGGQFY